MQSVCPWEVAAGMELSHLESQQHIFLTHTGWETSGSSDCQRVLLLHLKGLHLAQGVRIWQVEYIQLYIQINVFVMLSFQVLFSFFFLSHSQ